MNAQLPDRAKYLAYVFALDAAESIRKEVQSMVLGYASQHVEAVKSAARPYYDQGGHLDRSFPYRGYFRTDEVRMEPSDQGGVEFLCYQHGRCGDSDECVASFRFEDISCDFTFPEYYVALQARVVADCEAWVKECQEKKRKDHAAQIERHRKAIERLEAEGVQELSTGVG